MSLYKRANSPYWWIRLTPIKGELKPLQISSCTANKRQAQQYHDKLKAERWEQDKLDVKPRRTWDEAAERFLAETTHKRTQAWDKSMLRWFHPYLGGKALNEINRALLDEVKTKRANGVAAGTVNRYMALVRAILRKACYDWEWLDRVPKVGMLRDQGGRIRALTKEEFARLGSRKVVTRAREDVEGDKAILRTPLDFHACPWACRVAQLFALFVYAGVFAAGPIADAKRSPLG